MNDEGRAIQIPGGHRQLLMISNRQNRVRIDLAAMRGFVARIRRALRLGRRDFNVCFVDDRAIRQMNAAHRGRPRPTDVLSFPWEATEFGNGHGTREFRGFLGDVMISAETARRNAHREGHSTANEIRWLILHGLFHLLGYDHETDQGEMTAQELSLRERLGIAAGRRPRLQSARGH